MDSLSDHDTGDGWEFDGHSWVLYEDGTPVLRQFESPWPLEEEEGW